MLYDFRNLKVKNKNKNNSPLCCAIGTWDCKWTGGFDIDTIFFAVKFYVNE